MLDNLGIKRIAIILILLGIAGAIGATVHLYLIPRSEEVSRELASSEREVNSLRSDIGKITSQLDQIMEQKKKFDRIEQAGFFDRQSRRDAQSLLQEIEEDSKVVDVTASIGKPQFVQNEQAQKSGYVVLSSPVEIQVQAMDDKDIFFYMNYLQSRFPGVLRLKSFEIKRNQDISGSLLREIVGGSKPALAGASVAMTWQTMVPETEKDNRGRRP